MYVDSGSGSMIISAVVAGAAGVGVVAKMQARKLAGKFKKGDNTTVDTSTAAPVTGDKTEQQ